MSDTALSRPRPTARPEGAGAADPIARLRPAIAGAFGALAGIGLSELVAGFLGAPSLLAAIGGFVIDNQPPGAKDFVVSLFGTNDKLALEVLIVIVAAIVGAHPRDRRRPPVVRARRRRVRPPSPSPASWRTLRIAGRQPDDVDDRRPRGRDRRRPGHVVPPPHRRRRADRRSGRPPRASCRTGRAAGFLIRAGAVAVASTAAGLIGRRLLEGRRGRDRRRGAPTLPRPVEVGHAARRRRAPTGWPHPARRPERRLLPDRHGPGHALASTSRRWRLRDPRHGRREVSPELRRPRRAAAHRAVRDDLVRQQRGRRRARRQRQVDRRPAARRPGDGRRPGRRDAARRAVGRRLDGRHAHGMGDGRVARADDRAQDERRAAASDPRLPGPPDHPGPVRLRVGDEVADRARADDARGVQRLLDPARLGEGRPDPDPVADRHPARRPVGGRPAASRSRASPGPRTAGSRRSRSRSTGSGRMRQLSTPISDATWVQWLVAWDAAAAGRGSARDRGPGDRRRRRRPDDRPDAAGSGRSAWPSHDPGERRAEVPGSGTVDGAKSAQIGTVR